jgi:hypothetical protein
VYPREEEGLDSKPHDGHAVGRGGVDKNKWDRGQFGKDQHTFRLASSHSNEDGGKVLTEHQDRIRFMKPRQVEEVGSCGKNGFECAFSI